MNQWIWHILLIFAMDTNQEIAFVLCVLVCAGARCGANEIMSLTSTPQLITECHKHATLSCNITSRDEPKFLQFQWMGPGHHRSVLCELDKRGAAVSHRGDVKCIYRDKQLFLILHHVKPVHEGRYLCKLRSDLGSKETHTDLQLQGCHGEFYYHRHGNNVTCHSRGAYPKVHIHWLAEDRNLTEFAVSNQDKQAEDGTYEAASTLLDEHHTLDAELNCSLWSPSTDKYLRSTRILPTTTLPQLRELSKGRRVRSFGILLTLLAAVTSLSL